jgi:hypothetical protein
MQLQCLGDRILLSDSEHPISLLATFYNELDTAYLCSVWDSQQRPAGVEAIVYSPAPLLEYIAKNSFAIHQEATEKENSPFHMGVPAQ